MSISVGVHVVQSTICVGLTIHTCMGCNVNSYHTKVCRLFCISCAGILNTSISFIIHCLYKSCFPFVLTVMPSVVASYNINSLNVYRQIESTTIIILIVDILFSIECNSYIPCTGHGLKKE